MNNIKHRKISKYPAKYRRNFCPATGCDLSVLRAVSLFCSG